MINDIFLLYRYILRQRQEFWGALLFPSLFFLDSFLSHRTSSLLLVVVVVLDTAATDFDVVALLVVEKNDSNNNSTVCETSTNKHPKLQPR
jgi:hypothetical protein